MFAWALMNEKLFIITFFREAHLPVRSERNNERKLITRVSYQVKLIINQTRRCAVCDFFAYRFSRRLIERRHAHGRCSRAI